MPRRRHLALPGLLLLAAAASACDWTEFDDLKLQTPVRALSRPEDMDSTRYPTFVLPVTQPRGNAELLVTGTDNVALSDFTFGPKGQVGTETISNDRFDLNGAEVGPLAQAAYLPHGDGIPRIVAVTDEGWQPIVINLDGTAMDFAVTALGDPLPVECGALAVGDSRGAGETDLVLAAGTEIRVLPGASAATAQSCTLDTPVAALAVGDGWIVAGQGAGEGKAWLLRPDYAAATVGGPCLDQTLLGDHTNVVGFGTVVVAADVDGDEAPDIVVSAPNERKLYFYSAVDGTLMTGAYAPRPFAGASTGCGTSVAVGKVEGRRTLVVGDPGDPGAVAAPGTVWLVDLETGADLAALPRPTEDVQRFGTQVGVLWYDGKNGPIDLLWVTAEAVLERDPGVVYLYYWTHHADTDPRDL